MLSGSSGYSYTYLWHRLVEPYSRTRLTYEQDRLNAIAGKASLLRDQLDHNSDYFLGLWHRSLLRDMLWWSIERESKPRDTQQQPGVNESWSWMSIPLGIRELRYNDLLIEGAHAKVEGVHYDQQSSRLPLSRVAAEAYVEIEGQLITALATTDHIDISGVLYLDEDCCSYTYSDTASDEDDDDGFVLDPSHPYAGLKETKQKPLTTGIRWDSAEKPYGDLIMEDHLLHMDSCNPVRYNASWTARDMFLVLRQMESPDPE
jgi:hypothetical protein